MLSGYYPRDPFGLSASCSIFLVSCPKACLCPPTRSSAIGPYYRCSVYGSFPPTCFFSLSQLVKTDSGKRFALAGIVIFLIIASALAGSVTYREGRIVARSNRILGRHRVPIRFATEKSGTIQYFASAKQSRRCAYPFRKSRRCDIHTSKRRLRFERVIGCHTTISVLFTHFRGYRESHFVLSESSSDQPLEPKD